jgi:hypothetical protein
MYCSTSTDVLLPFFRKFGNIFTGANLYLIVLEFSGFNLQENYPEFSFSGLNFQENIPFFF